ATVRRLLRLAGPGCVGGCRAAAPMRLYQLSVRPNSRMSRLPDDEVTGDVDVLGRSRRAVILIHGFANSPKRADRSYAALAAGLGQAVRRPGAPGLRRWDLVFWRGLGASGYWRSPGLAQAGRPAISPLASYLIPERPLATDPPTPEDEGPAEHELPTRAIRSRP